MTEFQKESDPLNLSPRRILLADNDTDSIDILTILLTLEGHTVEPALIGTEVTESAARFLPDMVLLYTGLPGFDGKMIEDLRRALPGTLFVALIDWQEEKENPLRWKEAGFHHRLVKPVQAQDVIALLAK